ncbi:DUF4157 domain-containing protein [Micromonospora rubida]|uniref:DUF4157 domain-containing protein n=1 Tax=Micromonospora rubida TaxID=2697657 RepID=A0ABW7SLG1_9ACTN
MKGGYGPSGRANWPNHRHAVSRPSVRGGVTAGRPSSDLLGAGRGSPLPLALRADMEARFGHDFSRVRIHSDETAMTSAEALRAQAYTVGDAIVVSRRHFNPSTVAGRRLIAHELTHVVQQRQGPDYRTTAGAEMRISHHSDRFEREAEANADRLLTGEWACPSLTDIHDQETWSPREDVHPLRSARTIPDVPAALSRSGARRTRRAEPRWWRRSRRG